MEEKSNEGLVLSILEYLKENKHAVKDHINKACNLGNQNSKFYEIFIDLGLIQRYKEFRITNKEYEITDLGESFIELLKSKVTLKVLIDRFTSA